MCILGFFHVSFSEMPPKKRMVEHKGEEELDTVVTEHTFDVSSPASSAAGLSSRSCGSLTPEQLEQILASSQKAMLEASHQSMMDLLATLTPPSVSSSAPSRVSQIKIPKWTDEESPFQYFVKFEKALKHNKVDKNDWGQLLPVYLSGRAQSALAQVDSESLDDYEKVKETLLESLGDTPACADRRWWTLSRQASEEPGQFYLRVRATGLRRLHGLTTRDEVVEQVILSRFLSLLPSECYSSVVSKQPKTGLEAARLVQEFEETRIFSRRRQPWRQDSSHHSQFSVNRSEQGGGSGAGGVASSGGCPQNGYVTGIGQSSDGSSSQASESMGATPVGWNVSDRKQVTCYGCGELGHICPNCPNGIRRIVEQKAVPGSLVDGFLDGMEVKGLRVDTGSGRTLVHKDFIPRAAYTGKTVVLDSWSGGQPSRHRVARIAIKIGSVEKMAEVVVVDTLDCPALLGNNLGLGMTKELLGILLERAKADQADCDNCDKIVVIMQEKEFEVKAVRATRARVSTEKVEVGKDALVSAQSEGDPLPLSEIFDISDDFFEDDPIPILVEELSS